jgi:ribonucleoside-diphosphate reductase subunit M2
MKVEIYGTEQCVYCKMAVSLCESNHIEYDYINVREGSNLQTLQERVGGEVRTVPQIFKDGQYLPGGYTSLQKELAKN